MANSMSTMLVGRFLKLGIDSSSFVERMSPSRTCIMHRANKQYSYNEPPSLLMAYKAQEPFIWKQNTYLVSDNLVK